MSICVAVSTFGGRVHGLKLPDAMSGLSYLIIHQSPSPEDVSCDINSPGVVYFPAQDVGISKSRNAAIDNAAAKYVYFMDDDVDFDPGKILELINIMEEESVDVGTCQHQYESGKSPVAYKEHAFDHTILSVAKVSSIDICVNVGSIRKSGMRFDERFGLGTALPSGEEYVFLTDCIKKGLKVKYYPILVGVHPNITSGMDFYTSHNKIMAKREMLKRVFGWRAPFFIFAFWLKKALVVKRAGCFSAFTKAILFGGR